MIDWGMFAAAGGIGAIVSAMIGFAVFWLNRGKAESLALAAALAAQRDTESVRGSLAALSGTFYVFRDKVAEDAKDLVNRQMLRDMEERIARNVENLGRSQSDGLHAVHERLDKLFGLLSGINAPH